MTSSRTESADSETSGAIDRRHARAWTILLLAGVFEIAYAVSASGSEGFANLRWSIATVVATALTIFTLSVALKTIDVGIGYAVWTGIGASGAAIFGAVIFDQALTPLRVLWLLVIIGGIVILKLASSPRLNANASADTPTERS